MPGFLFHVGAAAICPHGGQIAVIPSAPRVLVSGQPAATMADMAVIAGCAFNVSGAPQPCLRVQWVVPAARVLINGVPALTQASAGLCLGPTQAPQGPATIVTTQPRVLAI
jgi:uncharacterized Zn-binding protein involved in type VI secretion